MTTTPRPTYKNPTVLITMPDGTQKEVAFTIARANQYWAEKSREDIKVYLKFIYGWDLRDYQIQWLDNIFHNRENLIIAFRGSGKTDILCGAVSWFMGHNPWHSNMIASVSDNQAKERLSQISSIILGDRYKLVFPWIEQDPRRPWKATQLNICDTRMSYGEFVRKRLHIGVMKTASLMTTSVTAKNLTGNRISGFGIIDDPHDELSIRSPETRKKTKDWYYGAYRPCLIPGLATNAIITTRYGDDDLASDILENPLVNYYILNTPIERMNDKGKRIPTVPERFPISTLDEMKAQNEKHYRAHYLNEVTAFSNSLFEEEWLNNNLPETMEDFTHIIISVDPAVKATLTSDYSAIALCAIDASHNFYVLNMIRKRLNPKQLNKSIATMYNQAVAEYGFVDKVIIEERGQQFLVIDRAINDTGLPIKGVKYKGDKEQKAQTLETIVSNNRFYVNWNSAWGILLKNEMIQFPFAKYDDMVDTIAQAANYLTDRYANKKKASLRIIDLGELAKQRGIVL